jgi:hypothetical protein
MINITKPKSKNNNEGQMYFPNAILFSLSVASSKFKYFLASKQARILAIAAKHR